MREIDRLTERYGTPSLVLMENAASAVVHVVVSAFSGDVANKNVLVLCGRGNNGGEWPAAARLPGRARAGDQAVFLWGVYETRRGARAHIVSPWRLWLETSAATPA